MAVVLYVMFYTFANVGLLIVGDFPKRFWCALLPWI